MSGISSRHTLAAQTLLGARGGLPRSFLCRWQRRTGGLVNGLHGFHIQFQYCSQHESAPSSASETLRPCLFRVPITPDMIEVECVATSYSSSSSSGSSEGSPSASNTHAGADAEGSTGGGSHKSGAAAASSFSSSATSTTVHRVDPFSRGRMLNYLRRMGFKGDTPFTTKSHTVVTDLPPGLIGGGANAITTSILYTATLRLPLPVPHGSYVAEGTGETVKDAELLAAMHAERVCDALGVPLFRLPSMQQKYAENVRKTEGRYAPLPGDPLKPEGTPLPPPLRMVSAATESMQNDMNGRPGGSGAVKNSSESSFSSSFFSCRVAEAEIISSTPSRLRSVNESTSKKETSSDSTVSASPTTPHQHSSIVPPPLTRAAAPTPSSTSSSSPSAQTTQSAPPSVVVTGSWVEDYQQSIHIPWASSAHRSSMSNVSAMPPSASSNPVHNYDPTEGGIWQLTNIVSARLSPSKEALALPCVLDVDATQRMKDYFLQRGVAKIDECFTVTHVTVRPAGTISRMYVAELDLRQRSLQAVGKANSQEVALQLAAMHAELLLDALGIPLFPQDGARQARHAAAAKRFGRWAPSSAEDTPPPHHPRPLPLKQLVGGDDVWLDPNTMKQTPYQRTDGERLIAAHNELNFLCSDGMEVYPPEDLLEEAQQLLRNWQRNIAGNPYPDAIVMTRMGAFYRAATITPVPRCFGVRGGIAVGRTVEQAEALCALHAVDSLCALGIPLFQDAKKQEAFIAKRRAMGLPTCEDLIGLTHLKEWHPQEAAVIRVPEVEEAMKAALSKPVVEGETEASLMQWKHLMAALTTQHGLSGVASASARQLVPPYLPAYIVEGAAVRRIPHFHATRSVMQLSLASDCEEYGKDCKEDELISVGNEVKVCVQNYLRHQYALTGEGNSKGTTEPSRGGWGALPLPLIPSVCLTGYGRTGASVYNVAFLTLPSPHRGHTASTTCQSSDGGMPEIHGKKKKKRLAVINATLSGSTLNPKEASKPSTETPTATSTPQTSHLAIGIAMKKKDAERACYLHAAATLYHMCGEDVLSKHRAGLPRQSLVSSYEALQAKCLRSPPFCNEDELPTTSQDPSHQSAVVKPPLECPKPFIHTTMLSFLNSGRFESPSKPKRPSPF